MRYTLEFKPSAAREFSKLPRPVQVSIRPRIDALVDNPRPHGVEKVAGGEDLFRIRAGDYRVVYQVQDDRLFILVVRVGHRREVYRGL
ncbi:MAG: type II toxin-antitoxin system RelE/ParE family toxin [Candidatus Omnitrophica bacterium]|nr:type II toxin-antitoxin system RelE/ParE family toxin [Candidatus Omnitrophota bacterium]